LFFQGTDPTSLLIRFARETRGTAAHLDVISLGQGQGPKVEEVLSKALTLKGRWIFLHNCHLSASFMPRLRVLVNKYYKISWVYSNPYLSFIIVLINPVLNLIVNFDYFFHQNLM